MSILTGAPIFLIVSIGFVVFIKVTLNVNKKNDKKEIEDFIRAEEQSNFIRKKEIDSELFVNASLESLPINYDLLKDENPKLFKAQKRVIERVNQKMVRVSKNPTNRDLKNSFGYNNFEKIILYEEQFNLYIEALINFAESLIENGQISNAEKVLEESIRLGSEYLKSYRMLIDIYAKNNDYKKLEEFTKKIESNEMINKNEVLKKQINAYILKNTSIN